MLSALVSRFTQSRVGRLVSADSVSFKIEYTETTEYVVSRGWGVVFSEVFNGENDEGLDEDGIAYVDAWVWTISPDTVTMMGSVPCVHGFGNVTFGIPVENFLTEDGENLTDCRFFKTEKEADSYLKETVESLRRSPYNMTVYV